MGRLSWFSQCRPQKKEIAGVIARVIAKLNLLNVSQLYLNYYRKMVVELRE